MIMCKIAAQKDIPQPGRTRTANIGQNVYVSAGLRFSSIAQLFVSYLDQRPSAQISQDT